MTYSVIRSLTALLGLEPREVEAIKVPIVTVCQLRPVKAFLLNIRALIVGIVWTGVADIGTPPLRYPSGQMCALIYLEIEVLTRPAG